MSTPENRHKEYDWMFNAYKVQGKTIMEISKELHISQKLVILSLRALKIY
jgi:DNA-binding transcriptional regulator LsrR (DeoR family)